LNIQNVTNMRLLKSTMWQLVSKVPVTLGVGLTSVLVACAPGAGEMLQFHRAEILAGEFWRLASGHLTHWNMEHIQWDLLMFVVLGAACEIRNPRRMRCCLIAAAANVSLVVFFLFPSVDAYRGLSGIDTALFTLLAIDLMHDARLDRKLAVATGGFLVGLAAKTAYEAFTGQTLFVNQQSAGFDLLVWDHITASITGLCVAFVIARRGRQGQEPLANGFQPHYFSQTS
jgi:rhomboid family GlyGly-CTERM serine protease